MKNNRKHSTIYQCFVKPVHSVEIRSDRDTGLNTQYKGVSPIFFDSQNT